MKLKGRKVSFTLTMVGDQPIPLIFGMARSLLLMMVITACVAETTKSDLSINNDGENCTVVFSGEIVPTKLKPPCQFVRDRHDNIRSHTYPSARMTIYLVMGKPDVSESSCSSTSQWFILGDQLMIPDYVRDDRVCVNHGGDEIAYRDAFHYIPGGKQMLDDMPVGEYD